MNDPINEPIVVVSGLPASGKTTLARAIAEHFGRPLLDKDDILEAMFDAQGVGDADWRQRLSRASDKVMQRLAPRRPPPVLVSFWRHRASSSQTSGTPIDWIRNGRQSVIEVHCQCGPEIAVKRFAERTRHPGHLDEMRLRNRTHLLKRFRDYAELGPLGIGELIVADTENSPEEDIAKVPGSLRSRSDPNN